jgi:CHAT domain-containing protein
MAVEVIVLPPTSADARPQMLLSAAGIWRDVTPRAGDAFSAADFRSRVETLLSTAMQQVSIGKKVNPKSTGFVSTFVPLYEELMPIEVRDALETLVEGEQTPLLKIYLHPSAEWIPWELLHDGTNYLGLRMRIVRLPIMSQLARIAGDKVRSVKSVHNLLGKDVLGAVIRHQWENTFTAFGNGNGWETRHPAVGEAFASLDELTGAAAADIIHVTCHGGLRAANGSYYWTLDQAAAGLSFNYRIAADTLQTLRLTSRPLVFGNACAAAAGGDGSQGALHGFGAVFMMKGALNFVGTFAPITQKTSVDFATAFYTNLLGGPPERTIAEAVLETKKGFMNVNTTDPSYLFYCLYGPPDIQYKVVH